MSWKIQLSFFRRIFQSPQLSTSSTELPIDNDSQVQVMEETTNISSSTSIGIPGTRSPSLMDEQETFHNHYHLNDELPLIKGTSAQGSLHQALQTVKWVSTQVGRFCQRPQREPSQTHVHDDHDHHEDPDEPSSSSSKCSMGIILGSLSCIFFATSALIVKISDLHPMELLCFRGFVQGILISPIVLWSGNTFIGSPGFRALLFARGTLGSVALILAFFSIHLIELGDAATVIFTSPVFVSLFACFCLGELCTVFDSITIFLTLLGVLLVSKPSFITSATTNESLSGADPMTTLLGTLSGLFAAILNASAFIILRQLKTVHFSVVVFWFSFILCFFGGVLTVALDGWSSPWDSWTHLAEGIGIGICGFFGQILLTKALQIETASSIAVTRTLDIVLSFIYQVSLLGESPDWWSIVGSGLVVSCVLLTATKKWFYNGNPNDNAREAQNDDDGEIQFCNNNYDEEEDDNDNLRI